MSDFSQDDFNKFLAEMKKLGGSISKISAGVNSFGDTINSRDADDHGFAKQQAADAARDKRDKDRERQQAKNDRDDRHAKIEKTTKNVSEHLTLLGGSSTDAMSAFKNLTSVVGGGAFGVAIGSLIDWTVKLTSSYQDLAGAGLSFTGGLLGLSTAAAQSGLTLENYSKLVKANSVAAARFGKETITGVALSVRNVSEKFGMYGYTVEGLNDITTAYMARQIAYGRADKIDKGEATKNIQDLARETAGLSNLFGTERAKITENATAAMKNSVYVTGQMAESLNGMKKANPQIEEGITQMASLPGEAGKMFSDMFAESTAIGTSAFSKYAKDFNEVGLGGISQLVDDAARRTKNGENQDQVFADFTQRVKGMLPESTIKGLQNQIIGGSEAAARLGPALGMLTSTTVAEIQAAKQRSEESNKFTKQMLNLDSQWQRVSGKIRESLLPAVGWFADFVANMISGISDDLGVLRTAFGSIVDYIGSFFGVHKKPSEKDANDKDIEAAPLPDFSTFYMKFAKDAGSLALVVAGVVAVFIGLKKAVGGISKGLLGMAFGKGAGGILGKLSTVASMTVNAAHVTVNGGGHGGLSDALGNGGHDGSGGKKSWKDRFKSMGKSKGLFGKILALTESIEVAEDLVHKVDPIDKENLDKANKPGENSPTDPQTDSKTKIEDKPVEPVKPVEPISSVKGLPEVGGAAKGMMETGVHMGLKATAVIGAAVDGYQTMGEAANIIEAWKRGEISNIDALKAGAYATVPRAMGWGGAMIGGTIGAAAGAPGGPLAIAGGVVGGGLGYMGGNAGGNALLENTIGAKPVVPDHPMDPKLYLQEQIDETNQRLAMSMDAGTTDNAGLIKTLADLSDKLKTLTEVTARGNNTSHELQKQGNRLAADR